MLMFPKTALQFAAMEQEARKGTLLEMESPTQVEARQSLRILPAWPTTARGMTLFFILLLFC